MSRVKSDRLKKGSIFIPLIFSFGAKLEELPLEAFVQDPTWPRITVTVEVTESLGSEVNVLFPLDARSVVRSDASTAGDHAPGEEAEGEGEGLSLDRATLWTARVNARTAARPGRQLTLAVNPTAFHYFDPATGHALARTEVLTGLPHA